MTFTCSICEEESTRICANCTKDTCGNHLCEKCARCSDCCACEVALEADEPPPAVTVREAVSGDPNHDSHASAAAVGGYEFDLPDQAS
ncbi:MAG: hypothetical protein KGN84_14110 [Acidobacteriota bacterium]|nr:hypothetical protein [Acidobacteriota bacterium]